MSGVATDEDKVLESNPSPPIDRLSLLPNELLDSIFESAYSDESPEAALSKHLYPFFEEHFYRRVRLYSPRQVDAFLRTISNHLDRARLVKTLDLEFERDRDDVVISIDILETLLPLLSNLVHLEVNAESIEVGHRSRRLFNSLSTVRSVSTVAGQNEDGWADLRYFGFLTALPALRELRVYGWPDDVLPSSSLRQEEEAFRLSHVEVLRIEGQGVDLDGVKSLVNLFPALHSVDFNTTYGDVTTYEASLGVLPSTLRSLRLGSEYASILPADHALRRFSDLRFLDLDEGCYSTEIHTTLAQLPLLVKIRLGGGTISPIGFVNLVSGPTRLSNLKRVTLDFDVGSEGRSVSYETSLLYGGEVSMEDWKLSEDIEAGTGKRGDYVVELTQSVSLAESNGIEVSGTLHEALALVNDYWVEASNRAILALQARSEDRDLRSEDFDRLRDVRQAAITYGVALPQLDIDSLNHTQLQLVKIELPERDWFMYSVRNRGESREGSESEQ